MCEFENIELLKFNNNSQVSNHLQIWILHCKNAIYKKKNPIIVKAEKFIYKENRY